MKQKIKAVCFDIDDTIMGFVPKLVHLFNLKYGTDISPDEITSWDFDNLLSVGRYGQEYTGDDLRQALNDFSEQGLYTVLDPLAYAFYTLKAFMHKGYHIILMTARPEKYKLSTELNLLMHEIPYDSLFFAKDKVKKLNELSESFNIECFADDKTSTVIDVKKYCDISNVYLVNQPHNKNDIIPEQIPRINSIMSCFYNSKK